MKVWKHVESNGGRYVNLKICNNLNKELLELVNIEIVE